MVNLTYYTDNDNLYNGSTLHQDIINPLFVYDKLFNKPFSRRQPSFVGNASFLLDELLYSIGPDNGSDQVALVGAGIFLLHCLLSPAQMTELVWRYMTFIQSSKLI